MRTRSIIGAGVAGLAMSLLTVMPGWAQGGSFEVRTTADTVDAKIGDGVCADAAGACSLRAAVQEANAAGGGEVELRGGARYALTSAGRARMPPPPVTSTSPRGSRWPVAARRSTPAAPTASCTCSPGGR